MANPHFTDSPENGQSNNSESGTIRGLWFKYSWEHKAVPVEVGLYKYGRLAYVSFHFAGRLMQLVGPQNELAVELRRLAALCESVTVAESGELPHVLKRPETAWPFLVGRFPWLFDGIDLNKEPYAHYLKRGQVSQDVEKLRPFVSDLIGDNGDLIRGYTRRAAGVLFGDESLNGGQNLKRIKKAVEKLRQEFTTAAEPEPVPVIYVDKAA